MSERPISPLRSCWKHAFGMAHARGHGGTQIRREDATRLYPPRRGFRQLPRSLARHGNGRRRFQVHLTEAGAQPPKFNSSASALRFFFGVTLDRPELAHRLARVHYPRKLPRVLSAQDVGRLLEAAPGPGLKYKAALSVAYGAGLRAAEVVMLRVSDIDSKRMLIRVEVVPVHAFGVTQGRQGPARDALTAAA